jgi:N6-adenosine-specific RNA methylase IME4
MSEPLLKLITAQRLLAETCELLKADSLAFGLRGEADRRAEGVRLSSSNGHPDTCRTNSLDDLVDSGYKFRTIYADPPWHYTNAASRGAAQNHYDTMTIEAIASLPVQQLVAADAHLHLWTTNAFLFEAKQVIEAWGFTYKSCLVWIKPQLGNGNYWRVSHEFLLLGVRGNLTFADRTQQSWICAERTQHSAKPRIFQKLIEHVSPPPRLELFARTQSDGWTTWGNQIQHTLFDDLPEEARPS